jgi:hypothetical protein
MRYHIYVNQILYIVTRDCSKAMRLCRQFILGGSSVRLGMVRDSRRVVARY